MPLEVSIPLRFDLNHGNGYALLRKGFPSRYGSI